MKEIQLTKGYTALVDDADYDRLSKLTWCACTYKDTDLVYAQTSIDGKTVLMHRLVMGKVKGDPMVDHRDNNGLNNQKENLRNSNDHTNQFNQRPHKDGKSKFKGVSWRANRNRWVARIFAEGKKIHLGSFMPDEEEKAAKCYQDAACKYHGEFAYNAEQTVSRQGPRRYP
jgi:hypothetical protein